MQTSSLTIKIDKKIRLGTYTHGFFIGIRIYFAKKTEEAATNEGK